MVVESVYDLTCLFQILEISHDTNKAVELNYDLEWLTVLHLTNHLLSVKSTRQYMPGPSNNERYLLVGSW